MAKITIDDIKLQFWIIGYQNRTRPKQLFRQDKLVGLTSVIQNPKLLHIAFPIQNSKSRIQNCFSIAFQLSNPTFTIISQSSDQYTSSWLPTFTRRIFPSSSRNSRVIRQLRLIDTECRSCRAPARRCRRKDGWEGLSSSSFRVFSYWVSNSG